MAPPGVAGAEHSPAPSIATTASVATTDSAANSTAAAEKLAEKTGTDDSSKLKTFLAILRKFIGVSDLAAVRFSLPAQLLEPVPNLEYWNYLDRPEAFISIGDSDDELGRMLEVLRFWFTKDLKYVKGKPCKPYNSALGEFFRCTWEVEDRYPIIHGSGRKSSIVEATETTNKPVKVHYLTEQTLHHPPVSAFVNECTEKGIYARGYDQISAKFTGTSIRVSPGEHNKGIFISLKQRDNEEYNLTHPTATLGGLLRGSLSVTVADMCFVTCRKTKIKAILHYQESGWLGRSQNKVSGVIFRYDPEDDSITQIKSVPSDQVLATIDGNWHEKIFYTLAGEKDNELLLDIQPLFQAKKICPPEDQQLTNESRRMWKDVTKAIQERQWSLATRTKQELEERQRTRAAEREKKGLKWQPRFFTEVVGSQGKPELSEEGLKAMEGLEKEDYQLKEKPLDP